MRRRRISTTVFVAALSLSIASGGIASAEPAAPSARIVDTVLTSDTLRTLKVDSPAMGAVVEVQVLTPAAKSGPRPTLYMLSGIGEEDPHNSMWLRKGQAAEFFADKNVNVVLPLAGPGSFYTDWQRDDPKLGRYQWETFLTEELPPLIDAAVDGNGRNAIAGLSMGAQSAMMLAARNPDVYSGVASYSGCFASAEPLGQASIRASSEHSAAMPTTCGADPSILRGPNMIRWPMPKVCAVPMSTCRWEPALPDVTKASTLQRDGTGWWSVASSRSGPTTAHTDSRIGSAS